MYISGGIYKSCVPRGARLYQRLGLSYEVEAVLRTVMEPGHQHNPWSSGNQIRNHMTITIFLGVGIRRGEFLDLRIDDIDLKANRVFIRGLPDNPDHPRLYEPNAETRARVLTITDALAEVLLHYLAYTRRHYPKSRRHDFFLAMGNDGSTMSVGALISIFAAVRTKVPGIPPDFGPQMCRHTWNDRYSDFCDANNVDVERERKTRCKIMGWKPGSRMAEVYTRRSSRDGVDKMIPGRKQYLFLD